MGGYDRAIGSVQKIPEGGVVQMGHIQDHSQILNLADGSAANFGKAPLWSTKSAGGERSFLIPGEACVSCSKLIELVNQIQILANTF